MIIYNARNFHAHENLLYHSLIVVSREKVRNRLQLSFIKILTRSGVTMTIVKAILWLIVNFWQKCKRFRLKYKRQNVDLLLEVTLETSEDIGHIWILILSIFFSLNFWIFSIVSEIYLEI